MRGEDMDSFVDPEWEQLGIPQDDNAEPEDADIHHEEEE